jgi:capsular polysaccharide biosynthesis protein
MAVAELSGEMFFHWQLELLPRLGRAWHTALERWTNLRLWHNGGNTAYVQEGLKRLGIGPERLIAPSNHVQAETLIVPNFAAPFGHPSRDNLQWLEQFWTAQTRISPSTERSAKRWFARPGAVRRAVLGENNWSQQLRIPAIQQSSIEEQLFQVAFASTLIAPHGAAMANLISATPGSRVVELVNPAYQPSYFDGLIQRRGLQHKRLEAKATPLPLQELLYEGPLAYPIDLRPGCSEAAEFLATLKND